MPSIAWRYTVIPLALVLTVSVTGAMAAPSVTRAGCPVITQAQAAAALGDVQKIVHHTQHTAGVGGGFTWLLQCTLRSRSGFVNVVISGDEKQDFDEARRAHVQLGKVKTVRGLGKAAYLFAPDPRDAIRELYVFHPSRITWGPPGVPTPAGPGIGAFAVIPSGSPGVPARNLIALARAVLKHPFGPLKSPKR